MVEVWIALQAFTERSDDLFSFIQKALGLGSLIPVCGAD
jgi:hypothetical protein